MRGLSRWWNLGRGFHHCDAGGVLLFFKVPCSPPGDDCAVPDPVNPRLYRTLPAGVSGATSGSAAAGQGQGAVRMGRTVTKSGLPPWQTRPRRGPSV